MSRVGEKYIIEITEEFTDGKAFNPRKLYRIGEFSSLVFDDYGLSKLEKYEDLYSNLKEYISSILAVWGEEDFEKAKSITQQKEEGEWRISSDGYYPFCSKCGYVPEGKLTAFCPGCGVKMVQKER